MPISLSKLRQQGTKTPIIRTGQGSTAPVKISDSTPVTPQAPAAQPAPDMVQAKPTAPHSSIGEVIGQYNEYGANLRGGPSMMELAERMMQIAEFAEQAIMSEADDWFDGHTIQRNMKEMKGYVKEFSKVAQEHDMLRQRATALYDDMGRVLERYFEIQDNDPEGRVDQQYDTDGDGLPDMEPGNSPKAGTNPYSNEPSLAREEEEPAVQQEPSQNDQKNRELIDRLLRLARMKLKGEQLVRFDTLPEETQIRAAWRVVR
jgi:hypothetical protein